MAQDPRTGPAFLEMMATGRAIEAQHTEEMKQ